MAKLACHKIFQWSELLKDDDKQYIGHIFFSILVMHANIAEIRKLASVTIYGLGSTNYFGFYIL